MTDKVTIHKFTMDQLIDMDKFLEMIHNELTKQGVIPETGVRLEARRTNFGLDVEIKVIPLV